MNALPDPAILMANRARAACRPRESGALLRVLFWLSVLWGASIFWLAPHPPMVDLPQHAGQVSLLKDLLLGRSPWSDLIQINLLTPYLIGYGLALPLAFVLPVGAALKVLLSAAYVAFVWMCVALRRHFGADARLDWLFVTSFFGFAYGWGFVTFLVAAPIGLLFVLLADRYALAPTGRRGALVLAAGLALLASHGLTFAFAWTAGAGLLAVRARSARSWLRSLWPFVILAVACAAYLLASRNLEANFKTDIDSRFIWGWHWRRLPQAVLYTWATHWTSWKPAVLMFVLPCVPWLLGLRIQWSRRASWVPFAVVLAILLLAPSFALKTAFLDERFALFLAPAYAWMFGRPNAGTGALPARRKAVSSAVLAVLVVACWGLLAMHSARAWRFGQESADFEAVLAPLQPGHRALSLVFDRASPADRSRNVYLHYPAWYQAEKHGLVDFNFAWFVPQIARFRPGSTPAVGADFEWHPQWFDWHRHRGGDYRYFIVRHGRHVPANLFEGAPCAPRRLAAQGSWTVFEASACP